jgi:5-methyltetrahydropteroyltriglutamate--homocysteine methyltransferase
MTDLKPPFHLEHVGSFLRPERLLDAARKHKAGAIDAAAFRAVQDDCIREIVAFQEAAGLKSITDGEFRRRSWSAGFIDAVEGFGLREEGVLTFKDEKKGDWGAAASPYAASKLRRKRPIVADDFRFLKQVVTRGVPKVTVASPPVMHFFLGPRAVDESVYPDIEQYYADLAAIYRDEIADLAREGCTYFQLDDTALPCNCDDNARAGVAARGEDPDALTDRYVRLINDAVADRPDGMFVGLHMCRGNLKGAWMAEGGYEPIAEKTFGGLDVDALFLEYDTPRAGDFAPLRHVSADKTVVLGLVSTKTPEVESKDELKQRIEEASRYVPLERLALSPQCGFSSGGGGGQVVTQDDTRRKIALMVEVVDEVWGGA